MTKKNKREHDNEIVLEQILENIPYYVFWKDRDSRYLGANKLFAKAASYDSAKAMIGTDDHQACWTKEEADFYRKIDRDVMDNDRTILNIEEPQKQLYGSTITLYSVTDICIIDNRDLTTIRPLG